MAIKYVVNTVSNYQMVVRKLLLIMRIGKLASMQMWDTKELHNIPTSTTTTTTTTIMVYQTNMGHRITITITITTTDTIIMGVIRTVDTIMGALGAAIQRPVQSQLRIIQAMIIITTITITAAIITKIFKSVHANLVKFMLFKSDLWYTLGNIIRIENIIYVQRFYKKNAFIYVL